MTNVEQKVHRIIIDRLGLEEDNKAHLVTNEASFVDDLGADSLDMMDLIMAFEDEFGIEIDDSKAEGVLAVGDVVRLLEGK